MVSNCGTYLSVFNLFQCGEEGRTCSDETKIESQKSSPADSTKILCHSAVSCCIGSLGALRLPTIGASAWKPGLRSDRILGRADLNNASIGLKCSQFNRANRTPKFRGFFKRHYWISSNPFLWYINLDFMTFRHFQRYTLYRMC